MNFQSAHFGAGTLDSSKMTFSADRLFSALAIESKKMGRMDEFVSLAGQY